MLTFTAFFRDQGLIWDGHIPAPLTLEPKDFLMHPAPPVLPWNINDLNEKIKSLRSKMLPVFLTFSIQYKNFQQKKERTTLSGTQACWHPHFTGGCWGKCQSLDKFGSYMIEYLYRSKSMPLEGEFEFLWLNFSKSNWILKTITFHRFFSSEFKKSPKNWCKKVIVKKIQI